MRNKASHLSSREYVQVLLKSIGITATIIVLFYRSIWAALFFPFIWFIQVHEAECTKKEELQTKLREEFLHGIGVLNSALQAGLSMENAWREVERETKLMYGASSEFYIAVKEINQKAAHNSPIEKLFLEFAYKSKQEELMQFAELLEFGKRSGSNWKKIIENTVNQMTERQAVKKQIEVLVAEKKLEQQIMNVLPLGLLAFLQISAGDYMAVLYHNWFGGIAMTIFLLLYIVAVICSRKILRIEL